MSDVAQTFEGFFNRRHVTDVILGIMGQFSLQHARGKHGGFSAHLLHARQPLALDYFEFIGGPSGFPQHLPQKFPHRRGSLALPLDRKSKRTRSGRPQWSATSPASPAPETTTSPKRRLK